MLSEKYFEDAVQKLKEAGVRGPYKAWVKKPQGGVTMIKARTAKGLWRQYENMYKEENRNVQSYRNNPRHYKPDLRRRNR